MLTSKLPDVGTTIFTVMSELAQQHDAINLSQGFPDFDAPAYLLERLHHHGLAGRNQYPPMGGVPALRNEIAALVQRCYGRTVNPDTEVTVTSGATEALFVAIQACVQPGDEVIVFDPAYDSYEPAVTLAGGRCRHLPLSPPDYRIDWYAVQRAITRRTRLLIVNSPHNPTGQVMHGGDWLALERIAVDHDLLVISDEVYEHIVFDGRPRLSANTRPQLAQRCFAVSSFGKTFHVTGWKVGYCIAPPALSAEFRKIHQFVTFTTFTAAQYAIADMLANQPEVVDGLGAFYQVRRDMFCEALQASRFELLDSAGSYFVIADYSTISDQSDLAFCEWLVREAGVAAIPLSPFYQTAPEQRVVRFCFAKREQTLRDAAARLSQL